MHEIEDDVDLRILRHYAGGAELANIGKDLGIDQDAVVGAVSQLAGFQRGRAREIVRQYESAHSAPKPTPAPAPEPDVKVEPRTDGSRSPVETVLARAKAAGGRYVQRAERIREQIVALDAELAGHEQVADAEKHVQALRAKLEEANTKLRALKLGAGRPIQTKAATVGEQAAERRRAREWAAANNISCPMRGVVPGKVMEKYRAAQRTAA